MLCSKCKKRDAVIFISRVENGETINEGFCMKCAKDLGISQINNILKKLKNNKDKDSEKYIQQINNQFHELMNNNNDNDDDLVDDESLSMFGNLMNSIIGLSKNLEDGTLPNFDFKFDFADMNNNNDNDDNDNNDNLNEKHKDEKILSKSKWNRKANHKKRKYLKMYGNDLTAKAADGKIDRIIGRDREIERVLQILNRRTKNNPCLIGEPGVGKTAIAEAIALRIVSGKVPPKLLDKEVFLLDLTSLVAGTQFRGQFESRVKGLIEEIKSFKNIILFIDEIHNLVGTGDSEGTMNAANILKPALSRGDVQVIGATTFNEYRKYIEKDSALERRFQPVTIDEPTIDQTVNILLGVKDYYENYHNVKISNDIIKKAVVLSEKYITDRFLPDKAIDLIDEACSCASLSNNDLNEYLKIKKNILKNKEYLEYLESLDVIDYEKVAQQKAEILKDEQSLINFEKLIADINVKEDHLAKVIELWTGIPAFKIKKSEFEKLLNLEDIIKTQVVGQDAAVSKLVSAVKRSRIQLHSNIKPTSFIFVGPTGVGKTKLAQVLAQELFDGVDPLIRLDMSEYMEKFSVSRIIGSPPGYIGYDDAGQLTEKVRRKPYSVILFDEIEKAHPDVLNILLQILDDGSISDSHGRKVSFENTIIIMTSNAGSHNKERDIGFNKSENQLIEEKAKKALSDFLRPEFLSRVDEIIIFRNLNLCDYEKISKIIIDELKTDVFDSKGIAINYSDAVSRFIANKSFNLKSGARDIKKNVTKEIEDGICKVIINNSDKLIKNISFDLDNNGNITYTFNVAG